MSKYSVKKPVTVLMCILIVIVLGVYSLTKQSLGLFPDMNLPFVVVVTPYAGASAEDVVEDVTSVVESQVTSMNNFSSVTSTSNQHYSIVMVEFNDGTNMDSVMIDLRSKLDNLTFPEGVTKPTILQISPDMLPVMSVSVTVDYPEEKDEELAFIKASQYIDNEIIDRLSRVEGVAEVSTTGSADILIQVDLDTDKISSYGYTTEQILDLVEEQNQDKLIGVALDEGEICMLHLGNSIENIEQLKNLPLPLKDITTGETKVVLLNELVKTKDNQEGIRFIDNNSESYSKVNGKKTISLSFQMQNGATVTDVTNGITEALNKIKEENPNFNYNVVLDQGEYINLAVGSVVQNLIYGAILAIVVLLLFLRDFRPTLIVGLSIPISVIATFMCMFFMDINLNMLSMGGLALGIGMLVDNAIVVIENIFRLRKEGKSKIEAAIEGAKGVASAITASTITTIVVFIPILFLGGTVKDVFANMAYTISFSLICSLVIALTMVPALASKILKEEKPKETENKDKDEENINKEVVEETLNEEVVEETVTVVEKESKIMTKYEGFIKWSLNHKLVVILIPVILFLLTLTLTLSKGFVLLPSTDEGSINATVFVNSDYEFPVVSKYTDDLTSKIKDYSDEIQTVSASFGSSSGMMAMVAGSANTDITSISITIKLNADHKKDTLDYANEIQTLINEFNTDANLANYNMLASDVIAEVEASENAMTALTSGGFGVKVKGYDLEKMEIVATKLAEIAVSVEGMTDVSSGVKGSKNNLKIYVNKLNAAKAGLTQQDFIESINLFLESDGFSLVSDSDTLALNFNGISYDISLPSNMTAGGMNLTDLMDSFGSYKEFLKSFVIFDRETVARIKNSGKSLYAFIPLDSDGNPILNISSPDALDNISGLKVSVDLGYHEATDTYFSYYETDVAINILTQMIQNPLLPQDQMMQLQMQLAGLNMLKSTGVKFDTLAKGKLLGDESDPNHISVVKQVTGYSSILSDGNYRYFNVSGAILNDYNVTKVSSEVEKKINEYLDSEEFAPYKDIVQIEFAGENEEIMEIISQMLLALLIGVLLVYMVMAIQFQSLLYPFIILGTLPLAFTGGFAFILIFNMEFSIVAIMGLIVLVGVAVNNGIVLIDYINQLREKGCTIREACIKASKTRLRPILMTSITTIVALIFSAIGISNGAELLQPLALTSIGGLLFSTILTLIVIPAIYMALNYKTVKKEEAVSEIKEN